MPVRASHGRILFTALVGVFFVAPSGLADEPARPDFEGLVPIEGARVAMAYIAVVDEVDDDVLLLRPAIIDLDVTAPDTGTVTWNDRVTNTADARRLFGRWADPLRAFLDQHYLKKTE